MVSQAIGMFYVAATETNNRHTTGRVKHRSSTEIVLREGQQIYNPIYLSI